VGRLPSGVVTTHDNQSPSVAATASVAWIVGVGASAGLGAAVARRYARGGLAVVVSGRSAGRLEEVAQEIVAEGGRAHAVAADVSDEAQLRSARAEVAEIGSLRAAVFNVGNAARGTVLELVTEQFEAAWRASAFAGFLFARSVVPALFDNGVEEDAPFGRGSLLFTGATASLRGRPQFAAFASAKAGLRSLAQSLAREYGPKGLHVAHVVIDGGIDGERLRTAVPQRAAEVGADGLLDADRIADVYWHLHTQHRSAWTHELDLRPFKESF
jgi:NAD(P)-dependent dehydrogenase (short-subunit alcohol dehydrogenase family)